ncbi:MAG: ferric reductase-like transmembrane domain-containing protein [Acidimicrobiales bacterium]
MLTTFQLAAASNGRSLWFLTRSSGLVSLVLLSATVLIGIVASVGWTNVSWPRFVSQAVHRNLSLFCLGFVGIHIVSTVADRFVPVTFVDAVLPFASPYRPIYVGLGALSFDLLLAVLFTSALRHRVGYDSWRFVHWLAYLCWPIALVHALGSGSDARLSPVLAIEAACTAAVLGAAGWRLVTASTSPVARRVWMAVGTLVVTMAIVTFAARGPLRPGWSQRAGTSDSVQPAVVATNRGAGATSGVSLNHDRGSAG